MWNAIRESEMIFVMFAIVMIWLGVGAFFGVAMAAPLMNSLLEKSDRVLTTNVFVFCLVTTAMGAFIGYLILYFTRLTF